jgi:hypothetical protein
MQLNCDSPTLGEQRNTCSPASMCVLVVPALPSQHGCAPWHLCCPVWNGHGSVGSHVQEADGSTLPKLGAALSHAAACLAHDMQQPLQNSRAQWRGRKLRFACSSLLCLICAVSPTAPGPRLPLCCDSKLLWLASPCCACLAQLLTDTSQNLACIPCPGAQGRPSS